MGPSYPASGGPASRTRFRSGAAFYFRSASEPLPGSGRLPRADRQCFISQWLTKQNPAPTKPFSVPAKTPGNLCWLQLQPTTTGRQGPRQGALMIKAFSAIAVAGFIAAALTVLPGFAPQVEASVPQALAKGDRLDIHSVGKDCSQQAWPNFETSCLRAAGSKTIVKEARLVTAGRTP